MRYLAVAAIFLVAILLVTLPPIIDVRRKRRHYEKLHVINHNSLWTEFVFGVAASKEEIDRIISDRGEVEGVSYRYNRATSLITLLYQGAERSYLLNLNCVSGTENNVLTVTQLDIIPQQGYLPYLINPFFIRRLNAVPIPYHQ